MLLLRFTFFFFLDNPVNRKLGRIAAKFPSEKASEVETNKQTNRSAASTSKFFNNDTGNNNLVSGRGRGTLGEFFSLRIKHFENNVISPYDYNRLEQCS